MSTPVVYWVCGVTFVAALFVGVALWVALFSKDPARARRAHSLVRDLLRWNPDGEATEQPKSTRRRRPARRRRSSGGSR
ncbi:hypothetical protein [Cryptosporangium aurantiacum]|nr:hypothetical protein [Cryptosporangium aurantiacum]